MNNWLKPLITFAVGLVLGVGGMYLAGVRPNPSSDDLIEVIPEVANLSSSGLTALRNNSQVVDYATLSLTLRGVIAGGDEKMLLYTDTVQLVHVNDTDIAMLEKPVGDPIEWAKHSPEAMMQSGKDVEIINALTGVRAGKDGVTEPVSVILHVRVSMRPFTRDEVVDFATKSPATVVATSGGLSIANG
ncbi:MAG: hypothetical protein AAB921_01200, partial [Patescibacteria group bacterium]